MRGMHGIAQIFENLFGIKEKKRSAIGKVIMWFIVFVFCNLTWVFFRAESIQDACYVIVNAFGNIVNIESYTQTNIGLYKANFLFCMIMIGIVAVFDYVSLKVDIIQAATTKNRFLVVVFEYVLLAIIVAVVSYGVGSNQFVYFQF